MISAVRGGQDPGQSRPTTLWLWGPVLLQMAIIFGLSSLSDPGPMPAGLSYDSGHFLGYVLLSMLLVRAIAAGRLSGVTPRTALLAAIVASAYGVTDEYHQSFVPGRTPDVSDFATDAGGASTGALGAVVLRILHRRWRS